VRFVAKRHILYTAKVSEGTNMNMAAWNTLEQLLALYNSHERHNAQRYRQTDGPTDGRHDDPKSRLCIAVRSGKNSVKKHASYIKNKLVVRFYGSQCICCVYLAEEKEDGVVSDAFS